MGSCLGSLGHHQNQVKKHLETAQDIARPCEAIMLAVRSEYALGPSGLPRRDTGASSNVLSSPLSQAHCTTWTPGYSGSKVHAQGKSDADALNPGIPTAKANLPSMNDPSSCPSAIPESWLPPHPRLAYPPRPLLLSLRNLSSGNIFTSRIVQH